MIDRSFLWGSATSAHQVEGGCLNNNWSLFESSVGHGGTHRVYGGQKAGLACDHWNRYRDDIVLMKGLSLNAYRFSVEWSKVEPSEGEFDRRALDHYAEVVGELCSSGITPMVTLHHFTNPIWFEKKGGFLNSDSPRLFGRFARRVAERLSPAVRLWCTINEPTVYAVNGYATGEFPPGLRDPRKSVTALGNLLRAHSEAYTGVKNTDPDGQIGPALSVFILEPASRWNMLDVAGTFLADRNLHHSVIRYFAGGEFKFRFPGIGREELRSPSDQNADFIGVNYYTRFFLRFRPWSPEPVASFRKAPATDLTDTGWEIYPEGLSQALLAVHELTSKPIYVTENGIADDSDTRRSHFIRQHLHALRKAQCNGVDVRGYFFWSLLDNFEWSHGFSKRFGLYHVDFATQQRTLKAGSKAYPEMIALLTERL